MAHNYSFKLVEEDKKPEKWPARVERLFESYREASKRLRSSTDRNTRSFRVDYIPESFDIIERIFEQKQKPGSQKVNVNSVYRVRTQTGEEFFYYQALKTAVNRFNEPIEPFDCLYGWHRRPVISLQWDEAKNAKQPRVSGYESAYEFKWDKEEVKKLLDSSFIPCQAFYVGHAGEKEAIRDRYYSIKNVQDFIEGSWDDLYDLGRLGISYPERSLHLVEPARKQERENREKAVGLNSKKVYIQ